MSTSSHFDSGGKQRKRQDVYPFFLSSSTNNSLLELFDNKQREKRLFDRTL
jgi:hypothetical protein